MEGEEGVWGLLVALAGVCDARGGSQEGQDGSTDRYEGLQHGADASDQVYEAIQTSMAQMSHVLLLQSVA